jgi:hypothetical protein
MTYARLAEDSDIETLKRVVLSVSDVSAPIRKPSSPAGAACRN